MKMHRLALIGLAAATLAAGCRPAPSTPPAAPAAAPRGPAGVTSSTERGLDSQPGVTSALPAVGRTVGEAELREIASFYIQDQEAGPQAYGQVIADLQKRDPKLYQAWQQKAVVILTGDPSRPSINTTTTIVAYTPIDAPTKGGLAAFLDGHADRVPPGFTGFTQLGQ